MKAARLFIASPFMGTCLPLVVDSQSSQLPPGGIPGLRPRPRWLAVRERAATDRRPCRCQRYHLVANLVLELRFERVCDLRLTVRLGPEVLRILRCAAKLERDEVILLVVRG